jgi:hypothetical protein
MFRWLWDREPEKEDEQLLLTRRRFLFLGLGAGAALVLPKFDTFLPEGIISTPYDVINYYSFLSETIKRYAPVIQEHFLSYRSPIRALFDEKSSADALPRNINRHFL